MSKSPWLHPCIHQRFHSILSTHLHGDLRSRIIGGHKKQHPIRSRGIFTWHWLDSYGKVWVNVPYMNPMGLYYLHFPSFTKINHPVSRIYKFQGHLYILVGFMYMGIFTYACYHGNQSNVGTHTIYMDGMGEKSNKQIIRHAEFFRDMLQNHIRKLFVKFKKKHPENWRKIQTSMRKQCWQDSKRGVAPCWP